MKKVFYMIQLSEKFGNTESFELPPAENFMEIKPVFNTSTEQAKQFWNDVFDEEKTSFDACELSDDQIIAEIFDRDESEFKFDIDASSQEIQNALQKFDIAEWEQLDDKEKAKAIEELSTVIADELNLRENPKIEYFEADENQCGFYNASNDTININKNTFDNPKEISNTVAHELWHAHQYERACIGETYTDILYRYNFENYIEPIQIDKKYVNFTEYQNQLLEAEARAFAKLFK